jgi:LDH2 family malate/lactate/ureidoglycolate dehydrogenase
MARRKKEGIPVEQKTFEELRKIAEELGIEGL